MSSKAIVQYFIQNDPWESLKEPNLIAIPNKNNKITVQNVYDALPLVYNHGENFYLRFYLDDNVTGVKVWIDMPASNVVPIYSDKIYVKVLRLPKGVKTNQSEGMEKQRAKDQASKKASEKQEVKKPQEVKNEKPKEPPVMVKATSNAPQSNLKQESPIKDNQRGASQPRTSTTNEKSISSNQQPVNTKPVNFFPDIEINYVEDKSKNQDVITNNNASGSGFNVNLIGSPVNSHGKSIDFTPQQPKDNNSRASAFFNDMDDLFAHGRVQSNSSTSPDRSGNIPGKSVSTNDFPDLSFVPPKSNSTSNIGQSESKSNYPIDRLNTDGMDDDQIKSAVDSIIEGWAYNHNERKNLCVFLSTMKEVWTNDPMWQEVNLMELIEDDKKARQLYKKAMQQFHPDKNSGKDRKKKIIAEKLYFILSKVYEEFINKQQKR